MSFLAPAALILAVVAAPIVAMYILKMRRPTRVVPSTFLWEQALRDVQANAPWQRLRPNLLLLLQLLALAALVLALARPYTLRAAAAQGDVVVVLDASYLMGATDEAPSRFATARARIGTLIDGLSPNSVMSIVLMARRPQVLIAQSGDRAALHAALDRAALTFETPDPVAALSVARALLRSGQQASLFVYTAAGGPAIPSLAGLSAQTHVIRLGHDLRDLGIVAFAATRAGDGTITTLANVTNLGRQAASSDVQLDVASSHGSALTWSEADLHPVSLAPGASTVVVTAHLPAAIVAVRAHLAAHDDLAADDMAWAVVPTAAPRRVVLVTPGDTFLHLALGLIPAVHLDTIAPDAYSAAAARCADTVVFDGWLPARLPATAVWAVGPPVAAHSPLGLTVGSTIAAAGLQPGDDPYNLLTYTGVQAVAVDRATPLGVPSWAYAVVRTRGQAVLVAGQNGARREVVLGFGMSDTDWELRAGFPILVENLLSYLAPPPAGTASTVRPGDAVALAATACATRLVVTGPDNRQAHAAPPFPAQPYVDTELPGLYTVTQQTPLGAQHALFAVNLFPLLQAATTSAPSGSSAPAGRVTGAEVPVEWAPLVAGLALFVLCGEWLVAARRR